MASDSLQQGDFLVIGSGIAGLRAAVELAQAGKVLLLAKGPLTESTTWLATGGIAGSKEDKDEPTLRMQEMLRNGEGLCREEAVRVLTEEGPRAIRELSEWGVKLQPLGGSLNHWSGHPRKHPRALTSPKGPIGAEILKVLDARARAHRSFEMIEGATAVELLRQGERVVGVTYLDEKTGARRDARASAVLLATGGLGQVYAETTNPSGACGDGVALAFRAGALISDMEFIQFHPTVLCAAKSPRIAFPEAVRHRGATLRNITLERFMTRYHEAGERAPIDVVSRAICSEMQKGRSDFVYLDMTGLDADQVKSEFPQVYAACLRANLDITSDLAPVRPAAHFSIGGVDTDIHGATTLKGLYAAGEVAANGVHGANRLAHNSLLEGLVCGKQTAIAMMAGRERSRPTPAVMTSSAGVSAPKPEAGATGVPPGTKADCERLIREVRNLMWQRVGVIREGSHLREAVGRLRGFSVPGATKPAREQLTAQNLLDVALLIAACAEARHESRGAHYRSDFPLRIESKPPGHSFISKDSPVFFKC
jgi:L-aspartate oxidase